MTYSFKQYLTQYAGVTASQFEQLEDKIEKRSLTEGKVLLSEGQVCHHFFYVEKGLLRFYSIDKRGREHILQFAPEKWLVVDRASFYSNEPSEFYIDTLEASRIAVLDEPFIDMASELSPQFRKYNERILQNHIRQLQKRIGRLIGTSAEERYLNFVEKYKDVVSRVPQWMIASYLGITPESLSRIRKTLANQA